MRTITDQAAKCLLKDPRATAPTLIYLVYRYQYTRFKISTGQTILPDLWDTVNGRARTNTKTEPYYGKTKLLTPTSTANGQHYGPFSTGFSWQGLRLPTNLSNFTSTGN